MPPTRTVPHHGAAIRAMREIQGHTIADFAKRLDITPQALSNIENNKKRLSRRLAQKIAQTLTVDLEAILCNHTNPRDQHNQE